MTAKKAFRNSSLVAIAMTVAGCGASMPAIADRADPGLYRRTPGSGNAAPTTRAPQADDDSGSGWFSNFNSKKPKVATSTEVVNDGVTEPMLKTSSVADLRHAIGKYDIIVSRGGWPRLTGSKVLTIKSSGQQVGVLNQRLALEGYLPPEMATNPPVNFTKQTQSALHAYQVNHGLLANGKLDRATRASLNVPAENRLMTLKANLPRVEEYTKNLARRYIVVNIPAAQLDSVENGRIYSRHNVIAGKTDRPSPVLVSKVSEINFNPYWNAPASIVEKDIIPKLIKKEDILEKLNIKVYDGYGGPEIDPATVDWATADPKRYHFRQEPGDDNAMASVKINFPNKYAVYMHDTPTKQLFNKNQRYFSSGCVRIDKVHILTTWILNGQDGWNRDRIRDTVKSEERLDVEVVDQPEVIFAYLTAWADDNGQVHFRDDVYHLDGTGFVSGQPEATQG